MKIKNCKLSLSKQNRLFELFLANTSARKASEIVGVHRNSGIRYFRKLRELIAKNESQAPPLKGIVEVDECYIGKQRGKKRGRNAQGKIILVGAKERGGSTVVQCVENVKGPKLLSLVQKWVTLGSEVYTDGFRAYSGLSIAGYNHGIVYHQKELVNSEFPWIHTNSIENVWRQLRRLFAPFNGVQKNIELFLPTALFKLNYTVKKQKELLRKWSRLD